MEVLAEAERVAVRQCRSVDRAATEGGVDLCTVDCNSLACFALMCGVEWRVALQRESWRISAARLCVRPASKRAIETQVAGRVVAQGTHSPCVCVFKKPRVLLPWSARERASRTCALSNRPLFRNACAAATLSARGPSKFSAFASS